ncbi:MAG TPA: hypothetical protein VNZ47_13075, partial [Candidatus Dormibacteraeota bacterium]|nr:hypothetical protein [Candidatus Dormibacteraeota bacterium]
MPELPDLLRQRLAVTENGAAQVHPDADTLTAFVEQSLPSTESETVVAHLSVCEPCREVVVLTQSLLAEPATQTVLTPAPVARWRRLFTPAFGAVGTVAAMAVIAVMMLQLPQKHPQQSSNRPTSGPTAQETQQAKATSTGDQSTSTEAKAAAPMHPADQRAERLGGINLALPAKEIDKSRDASTRAKTAAAPAAVPALAPPPPSPAKMAVLTEGLQKQDYVNTNFFTSSSADNLVLDSQGNSLPPAPQPEPSAANSAFTTANGKITSFADLPANAAGKSNVRILSPAPPQEHLGCTVCKIVQSTAHTLGFHSPVRTPALRAGSLSSSTIGGQGMFSATLEKNQPSEIAAAPAKADVGGLAGSDALSANAMAPSGYHRSTDSASPIWKVADGKL